jgi:hypothetical protein
MEVDPLASENKIRARRYRETAAALDKAARAYLEAAAAIDAAKDHEADNAYKKAQLSLESVVDELPRPLPKHQAVRPVEPPHYEWGWVKYMIPAAIALIILLFLVLGGTTGDLSQGWSVQGDIRDAVRYPKGQ